MNCDWVAEKRERCTESGIVMEEFEESEDDEDPNKPGPVEAYAFRACGKACGTCEGSQDIFPFPVPSPFHPPSSILLSKKAQSRHGSRGIRAASVSVNARARLSLMQSACV